MHYTQDWKATREAIKIRDRNQCMNCGDSGEETSLDLHHIVPRGQGGSDRISNLILLCRQCHEAAHEERLAPTVDFRTGGQMQEEEFEIYRKFLQKIPSARYDSDHKKWRVPVADMELLVESLDGLLSDERIGEPIMAD